MARGQGRRRRGDPASKWQREHRPLPAAFTGESAAVVRRRGREFHVRPIGAGGAQKTYTCPSCGLPIAPGTAHVVVWPADSIFGDEHAAAERRHWHRHCWRIG